MMRWRWKKRSRSMTMMRRRWKKSSWSMSIKILMTTKNFWMMCYRRRITTTCTKKRLMTMITMMMIMIMMMVLMEPPKTTMMVKMTAKPMSMRLEMMKEKMNIKLTGLMVGWTENTMWSSMMNWRTSFSSDAVGFPRTVQQKNAFTRAVKEDDELFDDLTFEGDGFASECGADDYDEGVDEESWEQDDVDFFDDSSYQDEAEADLEEEALWEDRNVLRSSSIPRS